MNISLARQSQPMLAVLYIAVFETRLALQREEDYRSPVSNPKVKGDWYSNSLSTPCRESRMGAMSA